MADQRLLVGVELLGVDFYTRAVGAKKLPSKGQKYLKAALLNEKEHYQSVVTEIAAGADDSAFDYPVRVDPGPPRRIAFSWGGILDNWRGVVYDPTGEVMKANILDRKTWPNRDDPDYASVAGLFGGTLVRAQHLEGNWYLCWFT